MLQVALPGKRGREEILPEIAGVEGVWGSYTTLWALVLLTNGG
jgi:hypothetical protein